MIEFILSVDLEICPFDVVGLSNQFIIVHLKAKADSELCSMDTLCSCC